MAAKPTIRWLDINFFHVLIPVPLLYVYNWIFIIAQSEDIDGLFYLKKNKNGGTGVKIGLDALAIIKASIEDNGIKRIQESMEDSNGKKDHDFKWQSEKREYSGID